MNRDHFLVVLLLLCVWALTFGCAKSVEIGSTVVLAVGLCALAGLGPRMADLAAGLLRHHFQNAASMQIHPDSIVTVVHTAASVLAAIVLPIAGIIAFGGIAANVAQTGFLLTADPLAPKFNRINPATGVKRILPPDSMKSDTATSPADRIVTLQDLLSCKPPDLLARPLPVPDMTR